MRIQGFNLGLRSLLPPQPENIERFTVFNKETHLDEMSRRGQLFNVNIGDVKVYKMVHWVFGIFEFQLNRMDREFAELCETYKKIYGEQFFRNKPQLMQVIPVEREIKATHETLTYEKVSSIIETGRSFLVQDCICKKEQKLLDHPCDRPNEVCMAIAPIEGVFDDSGYGRKATKEEAYDLIRQCEENALVHLTWNVASGYFFICNCCGCCCGVLRSINELGIRDAVNSSYYAEIDAEECTACGTCKDERCQVGAIEERDEVYQVVKERCIGCGLCISTCPVEAVKLKRKHPDEIVTPPKDEMAWYEKRGQSRGVDFSKYQ